MSEPTGRDRAGPLPLDYASATSASIAWAKRFRLFLGIASVIYGSCVATSQMLDFAVGKGWLPYRPKGNWIWFDPSLRDSGFYTWVIYWGRPATAGAAAAIGLAWLLFRHRPVAICLCIALWCHLACSVAGYMDHFQRLLVYYTGAILIRSGINSFVGDLFTPAILALLSLPLLAKRNPF